MKLAILAAILTLCASSFVVSADKAAGTQPEKAKAAKKAIYGTWELELGDGSKRLKFIGDGKWAITQSDANTGMVIFHHGGSYTFDGITYIETIEFATETTSSMIGTVNHFELTVGADKIDQKGIGNPWNEKWLRAKPKTEKKTEKKAGEKAKPQR